MKKILSVFAALAIILTFASCSGGITPGTDTTAGGTKADDGTTNAGASTDPADDETTAKQEEIMDLLEFSVTEGDFGDMFRVGTNWEGDIQTVANQSMTVSTSSDTEKTVVWHGPAAGRSFEYEAKVRVESFSGSYVRNTFETETHAIDLVIEEDKITVNGNEISVNTDDDYHLYRFSVTDCHAIFCIDAVKKAEFDLTEKESDGLISFSTKSDGATPVEFTVKYVKVKTTDSEWIRPSDRIKDITEWDYVEDFTSATLDSLEAEGWVYNSTSGATQSQSGSYEIVDGVFKIINSGYGEYNTRALSSEKMPKKTSKGSYTLEIRAKVEGSDQDAFQLVSYLSTGCRLFVQNKPAGTMVRTNDGFVGIQAPNIRDGEWHTLRFDVTFDETSNSVRLIYDGNLCGSVEDLHDNAAKSTYVDFINWSSDTGIDTVISIDYIKIAADYK